VAALEEKYAVQLSTLESMGFTDRAHLVEVLELCRGQIVDTLETLFHQ